MEQCKETIREYLLENFQNMEIEDDTDIFSTGVVNSLFAMQLFLFLQSEFNITIGSDDLDIDNFKTVNSMTELVNKKQNG